MDLEEESSEEEQEGDPEDRREEDLEEELSEEESSEDEQEEENQTNCKFAIAFVKTCLSLVDLLFTNEEEDDREENRSLKRELHMK